MKKEMKKVPAVRFTGFTGDWEQRKLGEIGSTFTGLSGKTKEDFGHGDARFVTYMNVYSNSIADLAMTERVEIDQTQNSVKYGDIFFTTSSETPNEVGMSSVWLGNTENTYLNSFCFGYRPEVKVNPYYMAYMLRSPNVRNKLIILAQGISRYNISKNRVMDIEVPTPDLSEQKEIGQYFFNLDHLITLHQRKSDQLKKLKAYFLQNLFPAKGEKVPKIRFKGFTDDWEQRKLEDYLETSTDKNFEGRYSKADVLSVSGDVGVVNQIEFQGRSFAGASVLNYGVVNTGDIVYTKSPLKSNPYGIIKTNRGKTGIVSTLYAVYHPKQNTDSKFIECYFDSDYRLNKYLHPLVNKGAKNDMKVTADNALKGIVVIPAIKGEQTQIAMFFSKIEELLTLHQRKLEALQTLKKFLLQNLFV